MTAETLQGRLRACGIALEPSACERLARYHELLLVWNEKMDLTAVTAEEDMLDRHYVDSLSPLAFPELLPERARVIDVGTGAGFPGLPLAIACPAWQVTLMDAQQKRLTFLKAVTEELQLTNVTLLHARAEDAARQDSCREQFDWALARAVAPLSVLAEYLLPFVRVGGTALCWKGPALAAEEQAGRRAAFLLGGRLGKRYPFTLPDRDWQHTLLCLQKEKPTPGKYPRKAGLPAKQPLGL